MSRDKACISKDKSCLVSADDSNRYKNFSERIILFREGNLRRIKINSIQLATTKRRNIMQFE